MDICLHLNYNYNYNINVFIISPDIFRVMGLPGDLIHFFAGNKETALQGKVVLVTGASSGIGRELAIQMHSLSMKVILAARNTERLEELRKEP